MLEYIPIILLGVVTGVFTGLIPGIHPNTIIFSLIPFYFYSGIDFMVYMCFITGLSISHTFHDFLPAIFLSAPEAEAALSSIPGVRLAQEGKGIEAFYYTVLGGGFSVIVFLAVSPFLFMILESVYGMVEPVMEYVLFFFLTLLIVDSDRLSTALTVVLLAGTLGVVSFSMPVNRQYVLVPVFTGLFAVPALIRSLEKNIELPEQLEPKIDSRKAFRGGSTGFLAGLIAGIFPGIGAAASTSFLSPLMEDSEKEFLAGMGGVNTTDIMMSFLAVFLLGKARSGASVALKALSTIKLPEVFFLIGGSLLAVAVSIPLALKVSLVFSSVVEKLALKPLIVIVLLVVLASTLYLTGFLGVLVLLTASFTGYSSVLAGDRKLCMAVLLVPSIMFFSSAGIFI